MRRCKKRARYATQAFAAPEMVGMGEGEERTLLEISLHSVQSDLKAQYFLHCVRYDESRYCIQYILYIITIECIFDALYTI